MAGSARRRGECALQSLTPRLMLSASIASRPTSVTIANAPWGTGWRGGFNLLSGKDALVDPRAFVQKRR